MKFKKPQKTGKERCYLNSFCNEHLSPAVFETYTDNKRLYKNQR